MFFVYGLNKGSYFCIILNVLFQKITSILLVKNDFFCKKFYKVPNCTFKFVSNILKCTNIFLVIMCYMNLCSAKFVVTIQLNKYFTFSLSFQFNLTFETLEKNLMNKYRLFFEFCQKLLWMRFQCLKTFFNVTQVFITFYLFF